jgi:hypothetical protein
MDERGHDLETRFSSVLRDGLKESVVEMTWKTTCHGGFGSVLVYGLNVVAGTTKRKKGVQKGSQTMSQQNL